MQKLFFVPDSHRPYHDKKAHALAVKAAKLFKPDKLIILGDYADCYAVSQHDKDPRRARFLDDEIADVNRGLDEWDAVGTDEKWYISGNHEDRLARYLAIHAPELFNTVKVEKLLKLAERGWHYVPYKQYAKIGKLHLTHDTGRAGKNAIQGALDDFQNNVIIGHVHRMGVHYGGDVRGTSHVSAAFGWLGSVDQIDYMHLAKARRDWQLGFGYGYMEPNGTVRLHAAPIINYRVEVEGKLISL